MAKFKDPYLKQIVDDLNIKNAGTIPAPLTVDMCALSNPQVVTGREDDINTRATLTIPVATPPWPAGSVQVLYRRLDINTLTQASSGTQVFTGQANQTVTLLQLLQKFSPATATYIVGELVDNGPFNLTRSSQPIVLTPKSDSLVLAPATRTLTVSTQAVDIGNFVTKDNIYPFTAPRGGFPMPGANLEEVITQRLFLVNGETAPVTDSQFTFEVLPNDKSYNSGYLRTVRITITDPLSYYTGTQTFTYLRNGIDELFLGADANYTEGQTLREVLVAKAASQNKYATLADFEDLSIRPIRSTDYTFQDRTVAMGSENSLVWGNTSWQPWFMKCVATGMYPFEEIIRFQVDVAGVKKILSTTNTGTMPVTIELLEKPAEFAPATLDVDTSFNTTQSLPVGVYKIRITRPDSYQTPLKHRAFNNSNPAEIKVTEVFKVKGHKLDGLFQYCDGITVVHPGAFDESTYTYSAQMLFSQCSGLTSLPANLFDNMQRCYDWSNVLSGTTGLTVLPDQFFGFLSKTYRPNLDRWCAGAGPTTIQTNLFKDAHYSTVYFLEGVQIQTVEPGVLAAMNLKMERTSFADFFNGCTSLTAIPADIFNGAKLEPVPYGEPSVGEWFLRGAFSRCTSLTTLPAALFQPLLNINGDPTNTPDIQSMFEGCTGLTSIPSALFNGIKFPQSVYALHGTFYGCTSLTSIPGDIFRNCILGQALGNASAFFSKGTFGNTGLTSIPADLFVGNETSVQGACYMFQGTPITTVPAGLLNGCTAMESIIMMFFNCAQLTTVSPTAFSGAVNLKVMEGIFRDCPALQSVPATLFNAHTVAEKMPYVFYNSGLTSIPTGLFANNVALQTVEGIFLNAPITGTIDNVFTNQPALTKVDLAFGSTQITSAGAGVFSGANAITTAYGLFQNCKQLTSVDAGLLTGKTQLTSALGMFSGAEALPTIPSTFFNSCTVLSEVGSLFSLCKALTSIPATLFANQANTLTSAFNFALGAIALPNVPAGLFANQSNMLTMMGCFQNCSSLTAVPNGFFNSMNKCTNFSGAFKGCSALTTIGTGLFHSNSTVTVDISSFFDTCTSLATVPDGVFFGLKKINNARFVLMNCSALTNVGRLIANELSTTIDIGAFLGGDLVGTGPTPFPDLTIADNIIDSTIVCSIGPGGYAKPFNRRTPLSKNIDNLFGVNIRIPFESNSAVRGWMSGMAITGNGQNFITKHQVPTTNTGFFTGSTSLSDYASLPSWAKA